MEDSKSCVPAPAWCIFVSLKPWKIAKVVVPRLRGAFCVIEAMKDRKSCAPVPAWCTFRVSDAISIGIDIGTGIDRSPLRGAVFLGLAKMGFSGVRAGSKVVLSRGTCRENSRKRKGPAPGVAQ